MTKIAAAIIAGGEVDPASWERCMRSLEGHVDGVFVNWNAKEKFDQKNFYEPDVQFLVRRFVWQDDFAQARNESFNLVPSVYDWIIWLDLDDTLEHGEALRPLIDGLHPATQGVMLKYEYAVDPVSGAVLVEQKRERLLRNDTPWIWEYPIHEVCHHPPGTQFAERDGVWIRHHRTQGAEDGSTRSRNRQIIAKARKQYPDVPRFLYYFANEVYAELNHSLLNGEPRRDLAEAAIKAYRDYVPQAPSPDDAYIAAHQIAECYRLIGEHEKAIESDLRTLAIFPDWPDAHVGIGQSYMELQEYGKAIHWATSALQCGEVKTTQVREPLMRDYMPLILRGIARDRAGDFMGAVDDYTEALKIQPNPEVHARLQNLIDRVEMEKNFQKQEPTMASLRSQTYGSRAEKSICFLTRRLYEPWNPTTVLQGGIGGAETCVMEVAKRFAQAGWRAAIFGTPGDFYGPDDDGVEWWPIEEWLAKEPWTIVVASRAPEFLAGEPNAKLKAIWMHDVNLSHQNVTEWGDMFKKADVIIALTEWHKSHLSRLYNIPDEKLVVVPNGIDLDRFRVPVEDERQPHKFVYSSSPDRGLDNLLGLWGPIKGKYPDAELHIFYGWNAIDKILESYPEHPLGKFRTGIHAAIDRLGGEAAGIFQRGRIDQKSLALELYTCDAWLYPTSFMETFCITALEMQAAGVLPVTSSLAAIKETVAPVFPLSEGQAGNLSYQQQFLSTLDWFMDMDVLKQEDLRHQAMKFAWQWSWEHAFTEWINEIASRAQVDMAVAK